MALAIHSLVRSIESEKLEEEEKARIRDVFARIESINDQVRFIPCFLRLLIACH